MINVDLLKKICETAGAPGFENRVRDLVLKERERFFKICYDWSPHG